MDEIRTNESGLKVDWLHDMADRGTGDKMSVVLALTDRSQLVGNEFCSKMSGSVKVAFTFGHGSWANRRTW